MGKSYDCGEYGQNLSGYHSLWRHKKICKGNTKLPRSDEEEEERVERSEVLSGDIDDLIDKIK